MKKIREGQERIIYNDWDYLTTEYENEIREFCFEEYAEDHGWQSVEDVPESFLWNVINDCRNMEWEDAEGCLKDFFDNEIFLCRGTVGRWNGDFDAGNIVYSFDELADAWRDCDYIKLYDINGHFYIEATHHDGTNCFEVKKVTEAGAEYIDNHYWNYSDRELHERLFNNSHYTHLPHFANSIYGCPKIEYKKAVIA